jgi:hypothetical protein
MAEAWRPWRSVAARLLWHYYAVKAKEAKETAKNKVAAKKRGTQRKKKSTSSNKGTA